MQLRIGATGPEVSALKKDLIILGYPLNDSGLNKGAFGRKTEAAVLDFQKRNNLTQDGWAGPFTKIRLRVRVTEKLTGTPVVPVPGTKPPVKGAQYWKEGPYHPLFVIPEGYTHLHPFDVLYYVRGEREILGSRDNPLIAHFHEHTTLAKPETGGPEDLINHYHDEVAHCASAQCWAADGSGCHKPSRSNALASQWGAPYAKEHKAKVYKKGDLIPRGALIHKKKGKRNHITLNNRPFIWTGKGEYEGFGSNQNNTIKTSTYPQSDILHICEFVPKAGTVLAPITASPVPSTGTDNESTR